MEIPENIKELQNKIKELERAMSYWALDQCRGGNDTPEVRDLITKSCDAFYYCLNIKDRPEVRSKITESCYARWYCEEVKDRPEIRKYIKGKNNEEEKNYICINGKKAEIPTDLLKLIKEIK